MLRHTCAVCVRMHSGTLKRLKKIKRNKSHTHTHGCTKWNGEKAKTKGPKRTEKEIKVWDKSRMYGTVFPHILFKMESAIWGISWRTFCSSSYSTFIVSLIFWFILFIREKSSAICSVVFIIHVAYCSYFEFFLLGYVGWARIIHVFMQISIKKYIKAHAYTHTNNISSVKKFILKENNCKKLHVATSMSNIVQIQKSKHFINTFSPNDGTIES